jgi:acyl carrier protein
MPDQLDQIRALVCRVGKLRHVEADEDFYNAGLNSVAALTLLLELEAEFGVSIAEDQFVAARTVRELHGLVARRPRDKAA